MIPQATYQHIGRWIAKLRRMTAAGSEDVSAEQLGEYAAWLAADFPVSVFTDASCKAAAEAGPWFPAWAVLHTFLADWRTEHPDTPRIAGPPKPDPDAWKRQAEADRARHTIEWSDAKKVQWAVLHLDGHPMRMELGRMLAGLLVRHAPENLHCLPPEFKSRTGP